MTITQRQGLYTAKQNGTTYLGHSMSEVCQQVHTMSKPCDFCEVNTVVEDLNDGLCGMCEAFKDIIK